MKDFPFEPTDFINAYTETLIETRYPYTYACDFIRSHNLHICETLGIPFDENIVNSRAEASGFMRRLNDDDSNYRHIALVFADAYCLENHIKIPTVIGFRVNVDKDFSVGTIFTTLEAAQKFCTDNPRKDTYYSIETIFAK